MSSSLLNCIASKSLIIPAISQIPDLERAAILIESLSKITENESLKLDSQYLMEQGASLKKEWKGLFSHYPSKLRHETGKE